MAKPQRRLPDRGGTPRRKAASISVYGRPTQEGRGVVLDEGRGIRCSAPWSCGGEGRLLLGDSASEARSVRSTATASTAGKAHPDPASRFQPEGPHGPSQVVDPAAFAWTDHDWQGIALRRPGDLRDARRHVHPEGTWGAASEQLPDLAELGITVLEVMPVADFPGRFGWGYDGVDLVRPTRLYGEPDDFRALRRPRPRARASASSSTWSTTTSAPTAITCAVLRRLLHAEHETEWGEAAQLRRPSTRAGARVLPRQRRLLDRRVPPRRPAPRRHPEHLRRLRRAHPRRDHRRARAGAPETRRSRRRRERAAGPPLLRPRTRAARPRRALERRLPPQRLVALTGHNEAYYTDYLGTPQEFVSAAEVGLPLPGPALQLAGEAARHARPSACTPAASSTSSRTTTRSPTRRAARRLHQLTEPGPLPRHDRAAAARARRRRCSSRGRSSRVHARSSTSPTTSRSSPSWCARAGRVPGAVPQHRHAARSPRAIDPARRPATFERSQARPPERRRTRRASTRCTATCSRCAASDPVFSAAVGTAPSTAPCSGPHAFVLRYFGDDGDDRLLLVNLGPRPAPRSRRPSRCWPRPQGMRWETLWSSEDPRTAARGTPELETEDNWRIPGHAAVVLRAGPARAREHHDDRDPRHPLGRERDDSRPGSCSNRSGW